MRRRVKTMVALAALSFLTACYSDMQFGKEEPDEDTQEEQWWCKYRDNCEKADPETWW